MSTHDLSDLYYNPKTGYKSAVKMYKTAIEHGINVSLKQVENFIKNQPTEQLNKQKTRKVSYNHIVANHVNDVWQADLLDVQKWKRFNHGYRWILNVVDVYFRFAFAVPLKTKSTKEVAEAFRIIFKQIAPYEIKPEYRVKPIITPENLTTDNGKEFTGNEMLLLLKRYNIKLWTHPPGSHNTLGIIERFNKTLRLMLQKYWTANNTQNWIDVLAKLIELQLNYSYYNKQHTKGCIFQKAIVHKSEAIKNSLECT